MNKQKLIMEGWRRFLRESKQLAPEEMMLYFTNKTDNAGAAFNIVLYTHKGAPTYAPVVIGGIDLVETDEPCIPNTMYVGSIYRSSEYKGRGMGKLLYDIGFYIAGSMGFGLTSDKSEGTKEAASKNWDRMKNDPEYIKRATQAGNDTFDYDNSTPDPDDDCEQPDEFSANASDHSFLKKDVGAVAGLVDKMEANHRDHIDLVNAEGLGSDYLEKISSEAFRVFIDAYHESDIDEGWY